ncbi:MAG: hypothetical protein HRT74_07950 [Flavobacteriales bacterium]|nr:hypothetical protein [Flavobacteriales bacterium]
MVLGLSECGGGDDRSIGYEFEFQDKPEIMMVALNDSIVDLFQKESLQTQLSIPANKCASDNNFLYVSGIFFNSSQSQLKGEWADQNREVVCKELQMDFEAENCRVQNGDKFIDVLFFNTGEEGVKHLILAIQKKNATLAEPDWSTIISKK